MHDPLLELKAMMDSISSMPDEDWNKFSGLWKPVEARRKEILTSKGEMEHYLYFVISGVQRIYYFDDQNREATLVFTYAPSFGGVLDALMLQQPSRYYYETLTASTFLRIPYSDLAELMQRPAIEQIVRTGITGALSGLLERMSELLCYSSEEKFRKLLKRSPHILQLVPHKYLANYIGIDPTNFSKLINTVKI